MTLLPSWLGGTAVANGASVADYEAVAAMVADTIERWGRIDIIIANAGVHRDRRIEKLEEDDFDITFDVSVKGSFNMVRHAWPHMVAQGYGKILLTTSGSVFGQKSYWLYGSAKAAILGMVGNLRHEGKADGINTMGRKFIKFRSQSKRAQRYIRSWLFLSTFIILLISAPNDFTAHG